MGFQQSRSQNILYCSKEDYKNSMRLRRMHIMQPDRYKKCPNNISIYQCQVCLKYVDSVDINHGLSYRGVCKKLECCHMYDTMIGRK